MALESLTNTVLDFITAHPYITGGILAVVGLLTYFKLKVVLKAITTCLILGGVAYLILFVVNLATTGIQNTEKLLSEPKQTVGKSPN